MTNDPVRSAGAAMGEYAFRETGRERSMGEVLKDIFSNVQEMVRGEIRLARSEMREELGQTASSAKLLGIGAGLVLFGTCFALVTLMLVLALFMPAWAASLVVAVILGVPGAILLVKGKEQLKMPVPQKTIENVKENVEWMKNQTKS